MTKATPYAGPGLVAALALAAWMLWYVGGATRVFEVTRENGPVELATALIYFAAGAGVWALRRPGDSWRSVAALSVVLIAFGAREMDWHKVWTGLSVLKISFYLGPAPLPHKLLGGLAVLAAGTALVCLLARHAGAAWRGLQRRDPVAATTACFVLVLVVSKVLDRSVNVLAEDFQVVTSQDVHALVSSLEEILELGLPLLAVLGGLQHRFGPGARGRGGAGVLLQPSGPASDGAHRATRLG